MPKSNKYLLVIFVILIGAFTYLYTLDMEQTGSAENDISIDPQAEDSGEPNIRTDCEPTFSGGGGPYYQANVPFREKIVPPVSDGDPLIVEGQVLYQDCKTPIPGAVVDIWQADEIGEYREDWYRGRVTADEDGNYRFESVVPKGYGEGTGYRPPHIHFKIWNDGQELITSQMFFPGAEEREGFNKAYIMELEEETGDGGTTVYRGYHDIILPLSI